MKALDQRTRVIASNAWGGNGDHFRQHFEIEESDVGRSRNDHRASPNHNPSVNPHYVFKQSDVGRCICVQEEGNWHVFHFAEVL